MTAKTVATALLCGALRLYRAVAAPVKQFLGLGPVCRYTPSCSHYFEEAVRLHGPARGGALGLRRLLRCHPWGGFGPDPVPDRIPLRCVKIS